MPLPSSTTPECEADSMFSFICLSLGVLIDSFTTQQNIDVNSASKRKKTIAYDESLFIPHIPTASLYERSYMHRSPIVKVVASAVTDFILTASHDSQVKFWRKTFDNIEFIKSFTAHAGQLYDIIISPSGLIAATVGSDRTVKLFDVLAFDMSAIIRLDFIPKKVSIVETQGAILIVVSSSSSGSVYIYDANNLSAVGSSIEKPIRIFEKHNDSEVTCLEFVSKRGLIVTADVKGRLQLWDPLTCLNPKPKTNSFGGIILANDAKSYEQSQMANHLLNDGTFAVCISVSPDGDSLAAFCADGCLRLFKVRTGKLWKSFEESVEYYQSSQSKPLLSAIHYKAGDKIMFAKKVSLERELLPEILSGRQSLTMAFDESSGLLFFPCILGVKVINVHSNRVHCIIGNGEAGHDRVLSVCLLQGKVRKQSNKSGVVLTATDAPVVMNSDPSLFCSVLKGSRFYIYTQREPANLLHGDDAGDDGEGRDVLNEWTSESNLVVSNKRGNNKERNVILPNEATLHTTMGDIRLKFFSKECPRTVENFTTHASQGYYNGTIFHRVIKDFMIQGGDPKGNGTGGESIWGGEFEDEIVPGLKHDLPFTLSMANSGPNTNGSQFFITQQEYPSLDGKYTVFGRVVSGMDTVTGINRTATKNDRPIKEVKILAIKIHSG